MSAATGGNNAGQGSGQPGEAESLDLDGRQALKVRERPQAVRSAGRMAETQRAAAEGQASIDPLVADQALTASEQKRESVPRPPSETRPTPETVLADSQIADTALTVSAENPAASVIWSLPRPLAQPVKPRK